jgi:hypothetical protein
MTKAKYFPEGCEKLMSFQSQNCETSKSKREKHNGCTYTGCSRVFIYWASYNCIVKNGTNKYKN